MSIIPRPTHRATRPSRQPSRRSHVVAGLVALTLAAGLTVGAPAGATPLTSDPEQAAGLGATWLAGQVNSQGFIPGPTNDPDVSATIEAALALATAGVGQPAFNRIMTWARANAATIVQTSGKDDPGRIGYLLNLARVADVDPRDFGSVDLVARLAATLGAFAPGLYGGADPTYDGVFRQSLAITGLLAIGQTPPAAALDWLVAQQCTAPAAAAGGYLGYRADTSAACPAPDPVGFAGPDTNGTALAVQALSASRRAGAAATALDFLARAEDPSGGIAFYPGGTADPNSEALTVMAIVAGGESPSLGRWRKGNHTPFTALLSWQIGTSGAPGDQGAFASPFSNGFPDLFATRQAVWGAVGRPFPFTFTAFAPPLVPSSGTSTTRGPGGRLGPQTSPPPGAAPSAASTGSGSGPTPSPARVTATPRFTG